MSRLQDRYKLLTGGSRVLQQRQQTLRAFVDWSYDLLSEHEQVLLQRLSSFAGGCDFRAVEEVCGTEPLAPEDFLDLLASLIDKSLVLPEEGGEGTRYRMLETIRDYARLKLVERDDADGASSRHCDYYFAMAKDGRTGMLGPEQAKGSLAWKRITTTCARRSPIQWAAGRSGGCREDRSRLAGVSRYRGYASEGRNNLRALLAHPGIVSNDLARGHALYVARLWPTSRATTRRRSACSRRALGFAVVASAKTDIAGTLSTLAAVRLRLGMRSGRARVRRRRSRYSAGSETAWEKQSHCSTWVKSARTSVRTSMRGDFWVNRSRLSDINYSEIESDCERVLAQLALERGDLTEARACLARSLGLSGRQKQAGHSDGLVVAREARLGEQRRH